MKSQQLRTLIVGPSLGWAKNKVKVLACNTNACTKADFFDKFRLNCFVEHGDLVRDDTALELVAAISLSLENDARLESAPELAQLIGEIYRGGFTPRSVLEQAKKSSNTHLSCLLSILSKVDNLSNAARRVNADQALFFALNAVKQCEGLPIYFNQFRQILFENVIDLSLLEIDAIKALAGSGADIKLSFFEDLKCEQSNAFFDFLQKELAPCCKIDFGAQISSSQIPLKGIARKLLGAIDLLGQEKERLHFGVVTSPLREATWIAGQIAAFKHDNGARSSFGVLLCGEPTFANKLKRALLGYGINASYSQERPLRNSLCFNLLLNVMKARTQNIDRNLLFGVLAHPSFKAGISNLATLGRLARNLDKTGVSSDRKDAKTEFGAYESALDRLLAIEKNEGCQEEIKSDQAALKKVIESIRRFPKKANLSQFLDVALHFVREQVDEHEAEGKDKLIDIFSSWLEVITKTPIRELEKVGSISLLDFIKWLERKAASLFLPAASQEFADGVYLLSPKALVGREFDFVAFCNLSHGNLPKPQRSKNLISEEQMAELNQLLGRTVFCVSKGDGEGEPDKAHQEAFESLRFLGAFSSARIGALFSTSLFDEGGREKAKSEYLDSSLRAMGVDPSGFAGSISALTPIKSAEELAFDRAVSVSHSLAADGEYFDHKCPKNINLEQVRNVLVANQQRKVFFEKSELEFQERCGKFAFSLPKEFLAAKFGSKLGLLPEKPLSPTQVESIARCRFKAFFESFVGIDIEDSGGSDLGMRELGSLAHEVLEAFFRERIKNNVSPNSFEKSDRERVSAIFEVKAQKFLQVLLCGHPLAAKARLNWLLVSILRMLSQSIRSPAVSGLWPKACEHAVGISGDSQNAGGIPLQIRDKTLYFGGKIDRVDEGADHLLAIDYKLGGSAAIKAKVSEKNIFKTHFQIPLYLHFLKHRWPNLNNKVLGGYLLSIKDGTQTSVLGVEKIKDLVERLDGQDSEDLPESLFRVLNPFFEGYISADVGDACSGCKLKGACRLPGGVA